MELGVFQVWKGPKIRDWFLEKDIFNKEMRKKLRKNTRIIPYEVPACRQAGMFYDNSLKLGKKTLL